MRWLPTCLLLFAFLVAGVLLGGTRPVFSLPVYAVLAAAGLLSLFVSWRELPPVRADCLVVTGIFIGWILLRGFFSEVGYLARADVGLALGALTVYLLTALVVVAPQQRIFLVLGLLALAVAQTGVGAMQHFHGERFALFGLLEPEDYGRRAGGFYICPNHLAGFLEVTTLLGLGVACWSRRHFLMRLAALAGAAASLFGLALTGSRGGYASVFCGLLAFGAGSWAVLRGAGGRRAWAGAGLAVVLSALLLGAMGSVLTRQAGLHIRVAKLSEAGNSRLDLWRGAWEQSRLQPLHGTGSGSHQYYARLFRPSHMDADPVHAHNDYLQLLAEYGAVGLLAGLGFLGWHLWRGARALREFIKEHTSCADMPRSDMLALNLGALGAGVAFAVHSFIDFNLHVPANAMVVAFVFGLLTQQRVPTRREVVPARPHVSWAGRLALGAAALWLAVTAMQTLPAEFHAERARQALRAERFEESIARAHAGLALDDRNPFLWLYLGQAHAGIAETNANPSAAQVSFSAAAAAFERGLRLYPQEQWLLVGRGSALDALGRFDEAEAVFVQALRWNPAAAPMHFHYATHLRLAGRYAEAEARYKKSLDLRHNLAAIHGLELLARAAPARP